MLLETDLSANCTGNVWLCTELGDIWIMFCLVWFSSCIFSACVRLFFSVCFWTDCKPEGQLFSAKFVCLSVCLWPALLPFNINQFWWNLVTRTLLWSSLAATIVVQIGRRGRGTARRLFENFKKFSKITEFEFQNSGPSFFASVSPVYCEKIRLDSNKTDGGDRFWSLPLWRFRQWHWCSSTTLGGIFWLNRRRAAIEARGHSELGAQSGRKNQPACKIKPVPEMTYNVFSGTLNPTHFTCKIKYWQNSIFLGKKELPYSKIFIFAWWPSNEVDIVQLWTSCEQNYGFDLLNLRR